MHRWLCMSGARSAGSAVTGPVYVLVSFFPVLAMLIAYLRGVGQGRARLGQR